MWHVNGAQTEAVACRHGRPQTTGLPIMSLEIYIAYIQSAQLRGTPTRIEQHESEGTIP